MRFLALRARNDKKLPKKICVAKIFWEKGAAGVKANRSGENQTCCKLRLAATWWRRRDSLRFAKTVYGFCKTQFCICLATNTLAITLG